MMLGIIISLNPLVPPVNRLPPPRRVFDRDGNGFITRDELQTAMEMIGEPLNEQQLEQLLVIADLDQDGRINYEGECNRNSSSHSHIHSRRQRTWEKGQRTLLTQAFAWKDMCASAEIKCAAH